VTLAGYSYRTSETRQRRLEKIVSELTTKS
jgi:hypothetical protein